MFYYFYQDLQNESSRPGPHRVSKIYIKYLTKKNYLEKISKQHTIKQQTRCTVERNVKLSNLE